MKVKVQNSYSEPEKYTQRDRVRGGRESERVREKKREKDKEKERREEKRERRKLMCPSRSQKQ